MAKRVVIEETNDVGISASDLTKCRCCFDHKAQTVVLLQPDITIKVAGNCAECGKRFERAIGSGWDAVVVKESKVE